MALSDKEISALYFEALGSQHLREQDRKMVTRFAHAVEAEVRKQAGAVPLTDEQIDEIHLANSDAYERGDVEYESHGFARAVEAHHGIKQGGPLD